MSVKRNGHPHHRNRKSPVKISLHNFMPWKNLPFPAVQGSAICRG
ncbi:hypothetical protein HMPREF3038_01698 [Akkermansia sp. KLE1797]|nr:hypothetical protein HMPREF3038_01698 [Akkermansia sp. KLE1797]KXU53901.1 hypothetical protein HMPREF3039_01856 [Akkermansia sp. KLE1798]KZA03082.1 hypothetical protein HMPREF1326_03126 [Akkermansia sp. KLE1605]